MSEWCQMHYAAITVLLCALVPETSKKNFPRNWICSLPCAFGQVGAEILTSVVKSCMQRAFRT